MTSSQSIKRREKSVMLNLVGAATIAFKSSALLTIETMAYEDKKVIHLYIDA